MSSTNIAFKDAPPSLAEFARIVADYSEITDAEGTVFVDLDKFHSVNISKTLKVPLTNNTKGPAPSVQYIEITITDRANNKTYPAKINLSYKDKITSKGLKSLEEREKSIANADPSILFLKDENPLFYEALDNFYFQVEAIYNDYVEKGIFVEKKNVAKNPAKYANSIQVPKLSLANNPVSSFKTPDGKTVYFYRMTIGRTKENNNIFNNPPRDSSKPMKNAEGKFINYEVCSWEGKPIDVYNIHNIINNGTIHFGEFDLSSMSASSMAMSAKGKFAKNKHFIIYAPKRDPADVSKTVDESDREALERINASRAAIPSGSSSGASVPSGSDNVEDGDGGEIDIDVGELDLNM